MCVGFPREWGQPCQEGGLHSLGGFHVHVISHAAPVPLRSWACLRQRSVIFLEGMTAFWTSLVLRAAPPRVPASQSPGIVFHNSTSCFLPHPPSL